MKVELEIIEFWRKPTLLRTLLRMTRYPILVLSSFDHAKVWPLDHVAYPTMAKAMAACRDFNEGLDGTGLWAVVVSPRVGMWTVWVTTPEVEEGWATDMEVLGW